MELIPTKLRNILHVQPIIAGSDVMGTNDWPDNCLPSANDADKNPRLVFDFAGQKSIVYARLNSFRTEVF
jgi:hypothetical protein